MHQPIVLIIEDDEHTRELLRAKLELAHCIVLEANNGDIGLKRALGAPRPDVILLDLIMPHLNGFEVLEELRLKQTGKPIPILLMTNYTPDKTPEYSVPYIIKCNWDLNQIVQRVLALAA